jgi:predicted Zn-dependent peptidase
MDMDYKKFNLGPYNLHVIKTDRFKNITVEVIFRRKIKKDEITIRNFLADILLQSTANYPTNRLLAIKSEELYNLNLSNKNIRLGNNMITSFRMSLLDEKYSEKMMLEESFKFLSEVIFNPHIVDNKFNSNSFNIIKNGIEADIKSVKDNMTKYSLIRMLEEVDADQPFSYRGHGYMEDLEKINEDNLYEYYKTMIKSDMVDIFVVGNVNNDDIKKIIMDNIKINTIKKIDNNLYIEHKKVRSRAKTKIEKEKINQSKLSIAYKLNNLTDFEKKYVLTLYSIILGGATDSKLFKVVREKNSLAYYIRSVASSVDNIMYIYSGIDKKNFDKATKLIKKQTLEMKNGKFSDEDLDNAKQAIISAIRGVVDVPNKIIESYFLTEVLNADYLDDREKKVLLVKKEDIINLAKKVHIDTIYLLEGE